MNSYKIPILITLILLLFISGFAIYYFWYQIPQDQTIDVVLAPIEQEIVPNAIPIVPEPANPIDQSIQNPLADLANPLQDLEGIAFEDTPDHSLDEVDYNPFRE